jgi:hypothetical protein
MFGRTQHRNPAHALAAQRAVVVGEPEQVPPVIGLDRRGCLSPVAAGADDDERRRAQRLLQSIGRRSYRGSSTLR